MLLTEFISAKLKAVNACIISVCVKIFHVSVLKILRLEGQGYSLYFRFIIFLNIIKKKVVI